MVLAYRIRYETGRTGGKYPKASVRVAICAGILTGTIVISWLWPEGREVLQRLLIRGPESAAERATAELAEAVFSGKGWYYGFTAFFAGLLADS